MYLTVLAIQLPCIPVKIMGEVVSSTHSVSCTVEADQCTRCSLKMVIEQQCQSRIVPPHNTSQYCCQDTCHLASIYLHIYVSHETMIPSTPAVNENNHILDLPKKQEKNPGTQVRTPVRMKCYPKTNVPPHNQLSAVRGRTGGLVH